jgi:cyclophilin family peptidyl-prolyl cis-trans isomerase/HEAT repeat protein
VRAERRRRLLCSAALLLLAGCAPAASPPPPAPTPPTPSDAEISASARLLRLEDLREFIAPVLDSATSAASPLVRRRAALALGRLGDARGVRNLVPLLRDPDASVAATAAFALGQLGDTASVAPLAAALRDPRAGVAAEAAYALGKLASPAAAVTRRALLPRADPSAVPEPVGSALLAAWRSRRPADLEPLLRWTTAPDPEVRWRAAYALTRRPDPRATPALRALASDADARVRAVAVRGLTAPLADSSGVGAAAVLPLLARALDDPDYAVRVNAARALGSYHDPAAAAALRAAVASGRPHLRVAAMESLGRIGRPAASTAGLLREIASREAEQVFLRQTALEALARVDSAAAAPVAAGLAADPRWRLRASAARALAAAAGPLDPTLSRLVADADGRVSAAALDAALGAAGDSVRLLRATLLERLSAPDVFVRATALGGLAKLADPATLPVLLDAYDRARRDTLDDAALAAVSAIAAAKQPGADPAAAFFARFDRSPDYLVRFRVRDAFGEDAAGAWGDPLPIETGRTPEAYRDLVERSLREPPPEVEIVTDSGTIRVRLLAADAPTTVESFLRLAAAGYFDGQEWPRVVPNFVVQGGDPRGDTNGGPGYTIRDEVNPHRYGSGTVAMALSGPDTGGSQFFVTHSPQPHLDGTYTVFGELLDGQAVTQVILPGDVIHQIRRVD